jgi:hypothetical protein
MKFTLVSAFNIRFLVFNFVGLEEINLNIILLSLPVYNNRILPVYKAADVI